MLPSGVRGVGSEAAARVGDAVPPVAAASGVRRRLRAPRRPAAAVTVAGAVAATLPGVFADVLANSQATSHDHAEQRFLAQATIAAGLTKARFSASDTPQVQEAGNTYGAATIDPRTLTALAKSASLAYAHVPGSGGRVLAAGIGIPPSAVDTPGRAPVAIRQTRWGQPWPSDLFLAPDAAPELEHAALHAFRRAA